MGIAALSTLGPARAEPGVGPHEILLGQTLGLKGGSNAYGAGAQQGVDLLVSRVNREGGIFGRKLAIRVLDDEGVPEKAAANARRLVTRDNVFALFGPLEGGPSTAVMQVATELHVPLLGPMAGTPTLRSPYNPLVFPVRTGHREEFRVILRHAAVLGLKRVGFMRSASEVGSLHLANVKHLCSESGLALAADLSFGSELTDAMVDHMVEQLKVGDVQAVFNHGGIGAFERLIRRTKAAGLATSFYGVNSGSTELAKRLGSLAVGMGFTQVMPNPRSAVHPLARAFRLAYDKEHSGSEPSYASIEGYVTAWVAAEALRLAGPSPTREGLVNRLQSADIKLPGATVSYRPGQHTGMSLVDFAVVDGQGLFRH